MEGQRARQRQVGGKTGMGQTGRETDSRTGTSQTGRDREVSRADQTAGMWRKIRAQAWWVSLH